MQVFCFQVNGKIILKSGTDFREFSALTLTQESKEVHVDIKKIVVDSSFEPDAELKEALAEYEGESAYHLYCYDSLHVNNNVGRWWITGYCIGMVISLLLKYDQADVYNPFHVVSRVQGIIIWIFYPKIPVNCSNVFITAIVGKKMDEVLGCFSVELDGRFSSIRTSETNLGNFICDIMLASCNGDVALLNSGTLRSDRIHPKGDFRMRDLMTVLPMLDPLLVLEITGGLASHRSFLGMVVFSGCWT